MNYAESEATLQDVFQELVSAAERPDAEALEEMVARYPRFASELTDFAVEWALQDLLPDEGSADAGESAVPEAMRRFRRRLEELDSSVPGALSDPAVNPFADRAAAELGRIATALGIDKTIMAKLRDRKIVAETVPAALRDGLAAELEVSAPVLAAHLTAPAVVHAGASFKAKEPPRTGPKETFVEAVRRSSLAEAAKARWRS